MNPTGRIAAIALSAAVVVGSAGMAIASSNSEPEHHGQIVSPTLTTVGEPGSHEAVHDARIPQTRPHPEAKAKVAAEGPEADTSEQDPNDQGDDQGEDQNDQGDDQGQDEQSDDSGDSSSEDSGGDSHDSGSGSGGEHESDDSGSGGSDG